MILAVLVLDIVVLDRVPDIDIVEADAGLCALVRRFEPALLGMSGRAIAARFRGGRARCFPSARSIRDWLDRFHVTGVHDVEREKGAAWVPARSACRDPFREVSRRLVAEGVGEAGAASVTIDRAATIIASGKRERLYSYRAAEGLVPGERGDPPRAAFCPASGMVPGLRYARRQCAGGARQRTRARGGAVAPARGCVRCHAARFRCGLSGGRDPRLQQPRLAPGGDAALRDGGAGLRRDALGAADGGGAAWGGRLAPDGGAGGTGKSTGGVGPAATRMCLTDLCLEQAPRREAASCHPLRRNLARPSREVRPASGRTPGHGPGPLRPWRGGARVAQVRPHGRDDAVRGVRGERRLAMALSAGAQRHGAGAPRGLRARGARRRIKRIRAVWIHLFARVVRHERQITLVLGG